jgi:hypothetical protein
VPATTDAVAGATVIEVRVGVEELLLLLQPDNSEANVTAITSMSLFMGELHIHIEDNLNISGEKN